MNATQRSAGQVPFQRFLDENRDAVWRFLVSCVGRADAEECFQETFMAALRAYPRLRADSNPRAWILTIANRKAIDLYRDRARGAVPVEDIEGAVDAHGEHAHAPGGGRDDALWAAVHELPPKQRAAVLLRHVADLSHREIAAAIDCSEEAARRSLYEGLGRLREVLAT